MAQKEIIKMSQKELSRVEAIGQILKKLLKQRIAANMLKISERQIRRIVRRFKDEGMKGLAHRSRGRVSNRAYSKELKEKVIGLYREKFQDFGPVLAAEKLEDLHEIKTNDETLRRWLLASGDWSKRRKGREHREWRARKEHFGEMIQMDGSHHDWFEGRREKCVLMGYIDDATNYTYVRFYEYEGTIPAIDSLRRYCQRNGVPVSIYIDRHSTYKSTAKPQIEDLLNNRNPLSEFERVAKELGVNVIHANSPQAKGRIERLFNTLQDRLVKEMRLAGIKTIDEANKFLPKYLAAHNRRFAHIPKNNLNMHKPVPSTWTLDRIFCIKSERVLKNDFTVAYNNNVYQILDKANTKTVIVEEQLKGRIIMTSNNRILKFKQIDPALLASPKPFILKVVQRNVPAKKHPWRQFRFGKIEKISQGGSPPNPPDIQRVIPGPIGHF